MPHCNATYKLAIKFANWRADGGHFYHPFQRYEIVDGFNMGEWWLKLKQGRASPSTTPASPSPPSATPSARPASSTAASSTTRSRTTSPAATAARRTLLAEHKVQYPYAYHFDASLLAEFLKGYATQRGVHQVVDDVAEVKLREDGGIASVVTQEHGEIQRRPLRRLHRLPRPADQPGARASRSSPSADSLLCDSAHRPPGAQRHRDETASTRTPRPRALSAGWAWNIPLYGRIGTGYVYSSEFLSEEEAEKEFRAHLGPASDGLRANHIKMRIGRCRNSWVKNCVAIGLSSGFVEPLESTGIFFIQHGIEELVQPLPRRRRSTRRRCESYNRVVGDCIDGVRDFLILHYCTTDRDGHRVLAGGQGGPGHRSRSPERLDLWKRRLPNARNINPAFHGFESYSYSVMLLGLNYPARDEPARSRPHRPRGRSTAPSGPMREKTETGWSRPCRRRSST